MSESGSQRDSPKAIVHKQILEAADANPEASIEDVADEVSGASPDLVERVLDTYGDPGEEQSTSSDTSNQAPSAGETKYGSPGLARDEDRTAPQALEHRASDEESASASESGDEQQSSESEVTEMSDPESVRIEELPENQRKVLRAIADQPDATQGELAERFDVTRATISRWVNEIPGFEWQHRREFVARQLAGEEVSGDSTQPHDEHDQQPAQLEARLDDLEDQLLTLRDQMDDLEQQYVTDGGNEQPPSVNPDLFAKIVRACVADDQITEDEEAKIITALR